MSRLFDRIQKAVMGTPETREAAHGAMVDAVSRPAPLAVMSKAKDSRRPAEKTVKPAHEPAPYIELHTLNDIILSPADPRLVVDTANKTANNARRGRPIVRTGDPKRDARNAQQRALMAKRRAEGKTK